MDFALSDEQLMLRDAARDWLARSYPADRVAGLADAPDGPGADPGVWRELVELGWLEAAAAGMVETGLLLEQGGYGLLPAPFFVTVGLAAPYGADPAVPTTLAWAEPGADRPGDRARTEVDGAGRVSGTKVLVPDLGSTSRAVVTTAGGPRLVELAGARAVPRSTIDRTRRLGDLVLDGTPSEPLPAPDAAGVQARLLAAAASEAVGVAQRALELAAGHARLREQFGRVIGTYQAVSHKIADMYVAVELARSLTTWACWAIDAGDPIAPVAAAAAKAQAGTAAVRGCEAAIQVHGGAGFTWDSVLHRYYKRAQWLEAFAGPAPAQRAAVAAALLDGAAGAPDEAGRAVAGTSPAGAR